MLGRLTADFGVTTTAQKAQLAELKQRQRAELAQLLTPTELADYDVRFSEAAKYVLRELPPAKSEAEFRQMVALAQRAGAEPKRYVYGDPTVTEEVVDQQYAPLRAQLLAEMKTSLGIEVVAAMEKTQAEEQAAQQAAQELADFARVATSAGLDTALAPKFLSLLKPVADLFNRTHDETEMTPAQQTAAKAEAKVMFERIAVEVFGEKGRELLKQLEKEGR